MSAAQVGETSLSGEEDVMRSDGVGLGDWVPVHSYTTESILVVGMDDGAVIRYKRTPVSQWFCERMDWLQEVKGLFEVT